MYMPVDFDKLILIKILHSVVLGKVLKVTLSMQGKWPMADRLHVRSPETNEPLRTYIENECHDEYHVCVV